jgi:hypothetical protein
MVCVLPDQNHATARAAEGTRHPCDGTTVYYEDKADTERNRADREVGEGDRNHRLEQAEAYLKEAEKIRERIKANEKLAQELQQQRSQIKEQMRKQ